MSTSKSLGSSLLPQVDSRMGWPLLPAAWTGSHAEPPRNLWFHIVLRLASLLEHHIGRVPRTVSTKTRAHSLLIS